MLIWCGERNHFAVLHLATSVNNVSYERYAVFVTLRTLRCFCNVSFVTLQKTLVIENCVFLRVLYKVTVPVHSVTSYYNSLYNGFF